MNAPNINVWGPSLWSILHGLAEKTGFKTNEKVEGEEKRLWRNLLMILRHSIPCPRCQKHYSDYVNQHPYHILFLLKGTEWGLALRTYLWTFHNAVRTTNSQSLDFPVERLETYRSATKASLIEWKRLYADNMRKGLQFYFLIREDMLRCLRLIEELLLFLV